MVARKTGSKASSRSNRLLLFLFSIATVISIANYFIYDYYGVVHSSEKRLTASIKPHHQQHHPIIRRKATKTPKATIGYAISLTNCGSTDLEGAAAILQHSIHTNSIHSTTSNKSSKYDYQMYAIVHPLAINCSLPLESLGYTLLHRDTPVNVSLITSDFLRKTVVKRGCCQEREFIKLYAYTITNHPVVVSLDLDTMLFQPLDELFDAMIDGPSTDDDDDGGIRTMFNHTTIPKVINAFFTRDYNMVQPPKVPGVQGGFMVLRPSQSVFDEYVTEIYRAKFCGGSGWGCKGSGGYYGVQQIQGVIPYYYDDLHPNTSVELNHCVYNNMFDPPTIANGKCRTGEDACMDCRIVDMEEIKSIHFTVCDKPWTCRYPAQREHCRRVQHEWFKLRRDLEDLWIDREGGYERSNGGVYRPDHFLGYCHGVEDYIPLHIPGHQRVVNDHQKVEEQDDVQVEEEEEE